MKQLFHILVLLFIANVAIAQAPQGIPYQAAARNSSGAVLASTNISVRFTIRDSIATGAIKYRETHSVTTTAQGMFSVNVGQGSPVAGTFSSINWATNAKFLQVEMDPAGGSSYIELGTQQMMSVPYALYAGNASLFAGQSYNYPKRMGFASSTMWTCPAGVTEIQVELWGGGGGGGGSSSVLPNSYFYEVVYNGHAGSYTMYGRAGGNGGAGGYLKQVIQVVPGTTYSLIIGAGGTGGAGGGITSTFGGSGWVYAATDPVNGNSGGVTSFGGVISVNGGGGGQGAPGAYGCPGGSTSIWPTVCTGIPAPLSGTNGNVTNFTYLPNPSTPTYIPSSYINLFPSCCASGGSGGIRTQMATSSSTITGGALGSTGQSGYIVISY